MAYLPFGEFEQTLKSRIMDELKTCIEYLREEKRPVPADDQISVYLKEIFEASIADPDYMKKIRTDGNPRDWKNDWIKEFIHAHSNFYSKWVTEITQCSRVKGMLYGLAIGDALGIPHEFTRARPQIEYTGLINSEHEIKVTFQWATKTILPGATSDDTGMSLALLRSLVENDNVYDFDKVAIAYMKWAETTKDIGVNTRRLFKGVKTLRGYRQRRLKYAEEITDSESNGALMRAGPLILATNPEARQDYMLSNPNDTVESALHVFLELLDGIYHGENKNDLMEAARVLSETAEENVKHAVLQSLDIKDDSREIDGKDKGWICHTLWAALSAFWRYETLSDAMEYVIEQGGDTDTNAAVAGTLFGAFLGFENLRADDLARHNIEILESLNHEITDEIEYLCKNY
jgi:ADP-ribosyl-[dinitrogen reductase] hydrolase